MCIRDRSATAAAAAAGVQGEKKNEQQTAYNPETGEINWDCPCLGGMAYGPVSYTHLDVYKRQP